MPLTVPGILSKSYASAAQTITSGGQLTLAHGLGVRPKIIQAYAQCIVADRSYSVGHQVEIPLGPHDAIAAGKGLGVRADATNIVIRFGGTASEALNANDASTGTIGAMTNTSWQLYVKAWA